MTQEKIYHSGQKVPETALYRVFHYQHRLPHDVVIQQGESFPACDRCGERVTFSISETAETIYSDADFEVVA
jgi:hypothetical protein